MSYNHPLLTLIPTVANVFVVVTAPNLITVLRFINIIATDLHAMSLVPEVDGSRNAS